MSDTTVLLARLEETQSDVDALRPHVVKLDNGLKSVVSALAEVKKVSDDLSELDDNLGTVSTVLLALQVVPVVGEPCGVAKTGVDEMKKGVHPVRTKANEFEARVKPVRDKISAVEKKVAAAIEKLDLLKAKAKELHDRAGTVYTCAQSKKLTAVTTAEDQFSAGLNPGVAALNKALDAATAAAVAIEGKLADIEDAAKKLVDIGHPIDDVLSKLSGLSKALDPIRAALNQKITIPYSVKISGPWYAPWKWHVSTQNFTFSVQQILDGVNVGIKFVNDALMKAVRGILNGLNLNLPKLPEIPGLDALRAALDKALGPIGSIGADLDALGAKLDAILAGLDALVDGLGRFDFKC